MFTTTDKARLREAGFIVKGGRLMYKIKDFVIWKDDPRYQAQEQARLIQHFNTPSINGTPTTPNSIGKSVPISPSTQIQEALFPQRDSMSPSSLNPCRRSTRLASNCARGGINPRRSPRLYLANKTATPLPPSNNNKRKSGSLDHGQRSIGQSPIPLPGLQHFGGLVSVLIVRLLVSSLVAIRGGRLEGEEEARWGWGRQMGGGGGGRGGRGGGLTVGGGGGEMGGGGGRLSEGEEVARRR